MCARLLPPTRVAATLWLIYLGPLVAAIMLYVAEPQRASDFAATIYQPGRDVLAGHSPYPAATLSALVGHRTFVYPPTMLAFDVPLALLPFGVARALWLIACAGGLAGALRVLDVRDPRCYALALLSVPAIQGLALGNITVLLVLLLALAWRYRDHPLAGGAAIGLLCAFKLLMWPLFVWLLITRRFKTAVTAAVIGGGAVLVSWAAIGFNGMTSYPQLLRLVSSAISGPGSLSVSTLAKSAGLPDAVGHRLQLALGLLLLGLAVRLGRRTDGDRRAFSVVVVAALVLTPVAWLHYFLFLLVPIALIERRMGPMWAIPWAFWAIIWVPQGTKPNVVSQGAEKLGQFGAIPSIPRLVVVLSLLALTLALTAAPRPRGGQAVAPALA
jgi:Glycosyltransferase family 87